MNEFQQPQDPSIDHENDAIIGLPKRERLANVPDSYWKFAETVETADLKTLNTTYSSEEQIKQGLINAGMSEADAQKYQANAQREVDVKREILIKTSYDSVVNLIKNADLLTLNSALSLQTIAAKFIDEGMSQAEADERLEDINTQIMERRKKLIDEIYWKVIDQVERATQEAFKTKLSTDALTQYFASTGMTSEESTQRVEDAKHHIEKRKDELEEITQTS